MRTAYEIFDGAFLVISVTALALIIACRRKR